MLNIKYMPSKVIRIFISFLAITFMIGIMDIHGNAHLKPDNRNCCDMDSSCDMDSCNHNLPTCPLCPSTGSLSPYLPNEAGNYLPLLISSLIIITPKTFSDQGFVKSIFHPPTSTL